MGLTEHMNGRKQFRKLFGFREDIRSQSSKFPCRTKRTLCQRSQKLHRHRVRAFNNFANIMSV